MVEHAAVGRTEDAVDDADHIHRVGAVGDTHQADMAVDPHTQARLESK